MGARGYPAAQRVISLDGILSQARMASTNGGVRRNPGRCAMAVTLKVNGASRTVPAEPDTPLLYVLRNDLELNGAKFGCGLAQCGACTVLVDGKAVRSCVTDIGSPPRGRDITPGRPGP